MLLYTRIIRKICLKLAKVGFKDLNNDMAYESLDFKGRHFLQMLVQKLIQLIEDQQLSLNQVFNCDETGLYWRLLPQKTLAGSYEKTAKNFKKPKDRVSILATANASGDFRLPLLMIGKSKNPRALKSISHNALPVIYRNQSKAWMDSVIFKSWFFEQFIVTIFTGERPVCKSSSA